MTKRTSKSVYEINKLTAMEAFAIPTSLFLFHYLVALPPVWSLFPNLLQASRATRCEPVSKAGPPAEWPLHRAAAKYSAHFLLEESRSPDLRAA